MERLVIAVQELSLARDLDTVMHIVRAVARELTGADGATFILRDGDFCFYADENAITPLWKGSRFPIHTCISGWSMLNRKPAVIEDIYTDDRIPIDAYSPTFVKSLAMVPIRTINPIGAIGNYWANRHLPTPEEVTLLQSLADITAVTLENVQVYAELEQRVKERTEQLVAANKELEAFSYSVSHDLRAPLRAIHGYIEILQEDYGSTFDPEAMRLTNKVMSSAAQLEQLIDDLLKFFQMGRKELVKTTVSMSEMVAEICGNLQEQEASRRITFSIGDLPAIQADQTLIRQVWINLLSNAAKYTRHQEQALIEISAQSHENMIVFSVKDNGAGFDMQYADKLFGIFERLHSVRDFEGTGIGLSIVQRVITKHGGRVWAEAAVGEGATFYFSLARE